MTKDGIVLAQTTVMSILDELLTKLIVKAHIYNAKMDYFESIQGIPIVDNCVWDCEIRSAYSSAQDSMMDSCYEAEWAANDYNRHIGWKK
jgi:hypothetical protein